MTRGKIRVRVVTPTTRKSFDGETAVVILAGTGGDYDGIRVEGGRPLLSVIWDVALVRGRDDDDPPGTGDRGVQKRWEECEIDPREIKLQEIRVE